MNAKVTCKAKYTTSLQGKLIQDQDWDERISLRIRLCNIVSGTTDKNPLLNALFPLLLSW